jgi:hypothetical protein
MDVLLAECSRHRASLDFPVNTSGKIAYSNLRRKE